jgi:WD40 repeat protein
MSVAFSPDGTRIAVGHYYFGSVTVWDAEKGAPLLHLKGHTGDINSVAFSPDGKRIVTGSHDRTVRVWDARTGTTLLELKGHSGAVTSVSFSADGSRILTAGGGNAGKAGEVFVWDAPPPKVELVGHTAPIQAAAFSPDGTRIVTASPDGTAKVWDASTGKEVPGAAIPPMNRDNPISPDGRFFARRNGNRVEVIPLVPDEEEIAYRRLHTQANPSRYRAGYLAARVAKDDFAAAFYLNLLPPDERKELEAINAPEKKPKK